MSVGRPPSCPSFWCTSSQNQRPVGRREALWRAEVGGAVPNSSATAGSGRSAVPEPRAAGCRRRRSAAELSQPIRSTVVFVDRKSLRQEERRAVPEVVAVVEVVGRPASPTPSGCRCRRPCALRRTGRSRRRRSRGRSTRFSDRRARGSLDVVAVVAAEQALLERGAPLLEAGPGSAPGRGRWSGRSLG